MAQHLFKNIKQIEQENKRAVSIFTQITINKLEELWSWLVIH